MLTHDQAFGARSRQQRSQCCARKGRLARQFAIAVGEEQRTRLDKKIEEVGVLKAANERKVSRLEALNKEVRQMTLDNKALRKQLAEAEQQLTEAKQAASQLAMHQFDSDDE